MRALIILALAVVCHAQDEDDERFDLTPEQTASCSPLGYFADPDDCCWYVQCIDAEPGVYTKGLRVACMGGSVWSTLDCACVDPTVHTYTGCVPNSCNVPEFVAVPCPDPASLPAGQCCVDGRTYTRVNATAYYINADNGDQPGFGPDYEQSCPFDKPFNTAENECGCSAAEAADSELAMSTCDVLNFDDPFFYIEGVAASGAAFAAPGQGGSAGAISFGAGAAGDGASAKLNKYSNVGFGSGFAVGGWVRATGDGSSLIFHNGDEGGLGATIKFEYEQSGSSTRIRGGALASDGAYDFEWEGSWSTGEWNHWAVSYDNGQWSFYENGDLQFSVGEDDIVSTRPVRQARAQNDEPLAEEEADNAVVKELVKAADEAIDAAGKAKDRIRNRKQRRNNDDPNTVGDDTDNALQGVLDCLEQIENEMADVKDYLTKVLDGLKDFRKFRRQYRKANNQFKKKRNKNLENRNKLADLLDKTRDAFNRLKDIVTKVCDMLNKICDVLNDKQLLKQLEAGSKKIIKKLKRKLKKLKAKFADDNPKGDKRFGLRAIDEQFPKSQKLIDDFDANSNNGNNGNGGGRKKRQADDADDEDVNTSLVPSKYPVTIGDNFAGDMDQLHVCNFAINDAQVLSMVDNGENPVEPMF